MGRERGKHVKGNFKEWAVERKKERGEGRERREILDGMPLRLALLTNLHRYATGCWCWYGTSTSTRIKQCSICRGVGGLTPLPTG